MRMALCLEHKCFHMDLVAIVLLQHFVSRKQKGTNLVVRGVKKTSRGERDLARYTAV